MTLGVISPEIEYPAHQKFQSEFLHLEKIGFTFLYSNLQWKGSEVDSLEIWSCV